VSLECVAACLKLDVTREQKFVLIGFANYADDNNFTWASHAKLCWLIGYSQKRSVGELVDELIELGLLALVEKGTGRRSSMYQVRPWNGRQLPKFDPGAENFGRGAINAPHDNRASRKSLTTLDNLTSENDRGAVNAPQSRSGADSASLEKLAVHLAQRRGAFTDTVAVHSAQHTYKPLSNPLKEPRRRAPSVDKSGAPPNSEDTRSKLAANAAAGLQIPARTQAESIEDFELRIANEQIAQMRARRSALEVPS